MKRVLEDQTYAWQVVLARDVYHDLRIHDNIRAHIAQGKLNHHAAQRCHS